MDKSSDNNNNISKRYKLKIIHTIVIDRINRVPMRLLVNELIVDYLQNEYPVYNIFFSIFFYGTYNTDLHDIYMIHVSTRNA